MVAVVLMQLWPGVPPALRVTVLLCVPCVSSMAARAAAMWLASRGTAVESLARSTAVGGARFVASDALLATSKYAGPLPAASLLVLVSYWAAQ